MEKYDLTARWYAVEDNDLGGWCIADGPNPFRRPAEGNILASVNGEDVARHIANIHNAAIDGRVILKSIDV